MAVESDSTESDITGEGFVVEAFVVNEAGCTWVVSEKERSGIGGKVSSTFEKYPLPC
jgi:hypothetical protein